MEAHANGESRTQSLIESWRSVENKVLEAAVGNVITQTLIETLKIKHKVDTLYITKVLGINFVFKEIGYKRFYELQDASINTIDLENRVFRECVVYPTGFDIWDNECMIVTSVYSAIINASKIVVSSKALDDMIAKDQIEWNNNFYYMLRTIGIVKCGIQPSELDRLSNRELIRTIAHYIAYNKYSEQQDTNTEELKDPKKIDEALDTFLGEESNNALDSLKETQKRIFQRKFGYA